MTSQIDNKTIATVAVVLGLGTFFAIKLISVLITFQTIVGG